MGRIGAAVLAFMLLACLLSLPWTLSRPQANQPRWFEAQQLEAALLPPFWAAHAPDERQRTEALADAGRAVKPWLGTDELGRDLLARCLVGGAISLSVGLAASAIAVIIGTLLGSLSGYVGGRVDAVMMRTVDVLYGLPAILMVVLLAVAVEGVLEQAAVDLSPGARQMINVATLLVGIGGVSWLTMARVIRGQVLSLKAQPFIESARAIGVPPHSVFRRHLLPNLAGPIIVYATLTVPTAILSESFLSFLGIGVREPLPSWGNLAAAGLSELNTVRVRWWLILWPCAFIATTLLSLNFMGEGLRERLDPVRRAAV